jgi:hypothetical protein
MSGWTQPLILQSTYFGLVSMKIEHLRKEAIGDRVRVVATVTWETLQRPPVDIFFETFQDYADDLTCNPNAFLTVCAIPAMRFGEERIAIDAPICPELKKGLETAMHCLKSWYGGDRKVIPIEAPLLTEHLPSPPPRAGCFFSGGIDALTMVLNNRLNFPEQHPSSFQDAILVYGILKEENRATETDAYQRVIQAIEPLARDTGLNLIPVFTNARAHILDLDPKVKFWQKEFQGAFLSAVAHALNRRFSTVSIASSFDFSNQEPWGSHPFIDPQYSSSTLRVHHEDIMLSRLEKTQILGKWNTAIQHLKVCNAKNNSQNGSFNCGRCEKCVRTKTELLVSGLLDKADTFMEKEVSKEHLFKAAARVKHFHVNSCYTELIEPLQEVGRSDLAVAIQRGMAVAQVKSTLKQWDKSLLNGRILSLTSQLKATSK